MPAVIDRPALQRTRCFSRPIAAFRPRFSQKRFILINQKTNSKTMKPLIEVEDLVKTYQSGTRLLTVLKDITFSIDAGDTLAVVGPSGSGKTTLLGLCAGLDRPSGGRVRFQGVDLATLSEDERARLRNQHIGFVFQNFQLIPTLTALENVMVPAELLGAAHARSVAAELLERVGLGDRLGHYPIQLSGGEQQRVALARAFINQPKLLFADEPTGNLDAEISQRIIELLFSLNREAGTTLVLVTHNMELAQKTGRILRLRGGVIVADEPVTNGVWQNEASG